MKTYEILLKGGYTGGHTSQRGWDMEIEYRAERSVRKAYPDVHVISYDNMGNTSGYYPSLVVKTTEEMLKDILSVITEGIDRVVELKKEA